MNGVQSTYFKAVSPPPGSPQSSIFGSLSSPVRERINSPVSNEVSPLMDRMANPDTVPLRTERVAKRALFDATESPAKRARGASESSPVSGSISFEKAQGSSETEVIPETPQDPLQEVWDQIDRFDAQEYKMRERWIQHFDAVEYAGRKREDGETDPARYFKKGEDAERQGFFLLAAACFSDVVTLLDGRDSRFAIDALHARARCLLQAAEGKRDEVLAAASGPEREEMRKTAKVLFQKAMEASKEMEKAAQQHQPQDDSLTALLIVGSRMQAAAFYTLRRFADSIRHYMEAVALINRLDPQVVTSAGKELFDETVFELSDTAETYNRLEGETLSKEEPLSEAEKMRVNALLAPHRKQLSARAENDSSTSDDKNTSAD